MDILFSLVYIAVGLIAGFFFIKWKYLLYVSPEIYSQIEKEKNELLGTLQHLEKEKMISEEKFSRLEDERLDLVKKLSQVETLLEEKNMAFQKMEDQMNSKFQEVAFHVLDKMEEKGRKGLEGLLSPLKEDLEKFKHRIEAVHTEETKQRTSLEQQIKILMELNEKMGLETEGLTKALVGNNKVQGDWGEFQVEMILENAGLRKNEEYISQGEGLGLKNEDGGHHRPDFLIKVPGEKYIIIDSKVSLVAYKKAFESSDDQKKQHLKEHVNSVINHIDGLSSKHYQDHISLQSPDFVLMFMPIESAFITAINEKRDLLTYAWNKKVIPVTPTNLFAVMKTVASIWKIEKQNKNAEEIANKGAALYDKFYNFLADMKDIGLHLDRTHKKYQDAFNKLSEGRGNIIQQVQKLEELGIKVKKRIEL